MADFVSDAFTDTDGTDLASHTGAVGASWTKHGSYGSGSLLISNANRVRSGAVGNSLYTASGLPASADYDVIGDVVNFSILSNIGVAGRIATGADTMYLAWLSTVAGNIELYEVVAGSYTLIDTDPQTFSIGVPYLVKLEMRGTTIKTFLDVGAGFVERCSAISSAISAAGRAGVRAEVLTSNSTGVHMDNFSAADVAAAATSRPVFQRRTRFFKRGF